MSVLVSSVSIACGDAQEDTGDGTGGTNATGGIDTAGRSFNECGVAAPLPAETGQCAALAAPLIANFDDFAGTDAGSYSYTMSGKPPAEAVRGAILHVDDGSAASDDTSVVATEMVTGEGDAGYAIQISNTNATVWGGLLMFYFPFGSICLDARDYAGIAFAVKGTSPSGRFGATIGMLDTTPTTDSGLCTNPTTGDCKDANFEFRLPESATEWTEVEVPWSAFTPGIGSNTSCVPATGQNILRLVIQPFMDYPPPDYMFEPGAYSLAVDNVRFY